MAVVNLPPATGSGKEFAVADASGADIVLTADAGDLIDGAATQTEIDDEALCVVDYKADNWIII